MHICQEMQYAKKETQMETQMETHPRPPCLGREFYYSFCTYPYFLRILTPSLSREGGVGLLNPSLREGQGVGLNRMRHAFHLFDSLIQAKVENTPKSQVDKKDDRDVQIFS